MEAVISDDTSDTDRLAGHCIDGQALLLLKSGDFDRFVEYRDKKISTTILNRVQSMARWGFRDHGSLPSVSDDSQYSDRYDDEY